MAHFSAVFGAGHAHTRCALAVRGRDILGLTEHLLLSAIYSRETHWYLDMYK